MSNKSNDIGDIRVGAFENWPENNMKLAVLQQSLELQSLPDEKKVGKVMTKRPSRTRPPRNKNNI